MTGEEGRARGESAYEMPIGSHADETAPRSGAHEPALRSGRGEGLERDRQPCGEGGEKGPEETVHDESGRRGGAGHKPGAGRGESGTRGEGRAGETAGEKAGREAVGGAASKGAPTGASGPARFDTERIREQVDTLRYQGYDFSRRTLTYSPPLLPGQALDTRHPVEPLLVLGGAFQNMYSWRRHEPALLAACGTVVTLDLPGWGRADALPPHHGIDFLARTVREAMHRAGHRRYHVLAASHGALVGHRLAQLCDETTLASLVLTGARAPRPAQDREVEELGALIALLEAGHIREFAVRTVDRLSDPAPAHRIHRHAAVRYLLTAELARTPATEHAKIVTNLQRLTTTTLFHDEPLPRTPTLVFTGEHDTLTPVAETRALAGHYPCGRWDTIPGTDHIAHLQRDDEYTRLAVEHLRQAAADAVRREDGALLATHGPSGPAATVR